MNHLRSRSQQNNCWYWKGTDERFQALWMQRSEVDAGFAIIPLSLSRSPMAAALPALAPPRFETIYRTYIEAEAGDWSKPTNEEVCKAQKLEMAVRDAFSKGRRHLFCYESHAIIWMGSLLGSLENAPAALAEVEIFKQRVILNCGNYFQDQVRKVSKKVLSISQLELDAERDENHLPNNHARGVQKYARGADSSDSWN
jgi:hypothetical protein